MKEHAGILTLLGLAAIAVIVYLWRSSPMAQGSNGSPVADAAISQPPQYPSPAAQPIQLGDVNLGGTNINLTYNTAPPSTSAEKLIAVSGGAPSTGSSGGDCGCSGGAASAPGTPTRQIAVTLPTLQAAQKSLESYHAKGATFSQAPIGPQNPEGGAVIF